MVSIFPLFYYNIFLDIYVSILSNSILLDAFKIYSIFKFKTYLNQLGYKNYTAFKDEVIFERIVRLKQIRDRYESFDIFKIVKMSSNV